MEIKRDVYLNQLILRKHNGLVKVITGIRRSGKSYLMNRIFYEHLIESGISENRIIRFAFDSNDDLSLIGENFGSLENGNRKVDPKAFMTYLEAMINKEDQFYLLLDEVQLLGSFEAVLNGYLRRSNLDIYVTGSNSKFLSSDVITEFAGRGDEIRVQPLAFSEFAGAYSGQLDEAWDSYLTYGGLPAILSMKTDQQKSQYLTTQMKNVYLRDIIVRNNLKSDRDINELIDILASGISCLTNPSKLSNTFRTIKNSTLAPNTIENYIEHLENAFIISKARRFDVKGKKYINTPFKLYFEDVGLRNARLNFRQIEPTHLMENIIYNELRYRGYNVDVGVVEIREKGVKKQVEVDFVANQGSRRYYIQSAYAMWGSEKQSQETVSFNHINDSFKKIIVVSDNIKAKRDDFGFVTIGIKEFLLNPDSLEL